MLILTKYLTGLNESLTHSSNLSDPIPWKHGVGFFFGIEQENGNSSCQKDGYRSKKDEKNSVNVRQSVHVFNPLTKR